MTATEQTVAAWIERVTARLEDAALHYGHGTDNPRDEAAWLVLHVIGVPLDGSFCDWGRMVSSEESGEIQRLVEARCGSGQPLAYLTGTAYFAGLEFEVTPDVLVPRSPIAELIEDGFQPWVEPEELRHVLDLCTGSGCIGIAAAVLLPWLQVDATDLSPAALAVAAHNVVRHGVADRVRLIESDLFQDLPPAQYDLIVTNPPYVASAGLSGLPSEYRAEPELGLASGSDGLDAVLQILRDAPRYLAPGGILVCEVGESEQRLAAALPQLPFLWLEFARGGSGVFLLDRAQLQAGESAVMALLEERRNVA